MYIEAETFNRGGTFEGERQGPDHSCGSKPAVWSALFEWYAFAV